jgi:hypothetical protein
MVPLRPTNSPKFPKVTFYYEECFKHIAAFPLGCPTDG